MVASELERVSMAGASLLLKKDMLYLRFANALPETFWNRTHLQSVKDHHEGEHFEVQGRGVYDKPGAIRDVIQNQGTGDIERR